MLFKRRAKVYAETIKDKLQNGLLMGTMARTIFTETLEKLEEANQTLNIAQTEAETVIKEHQAIADNAHMQKLNNLVTISNIMKVIGVEEQI